MNALCHYCFVPVGNQMMDHKGYLYLSCANVKCRKLFCKNCLLKHFGYVNITRLRIFQLKPNQVNGYVMFAGQNALASNAQVLNYKKSLNKKQQLISPLSKVFLIY